MLESDSPAVNTNTHTVEVGDTLWAIANANDMTVDDIMELNPQIENRDLIFPGQEINLGGESNSGNNPRYSSIEQSETPDAAFLQELCEDEGLALKITDSKIIIFDERIFEKRSSIKTIKESKNTVLSYSFRSSLANTSYEGVQLSYYDSKIGRTIEFLYAPKEVDGDSKIYKLNKRVSSGAEARRLAQKNASKVKQKRN